MRKLNCGDRKEGLLGTSFYGDLFNPIRQLLQPCSSQAILRCDRDHPGGQAGDVQRPQTLKPDYLFMRRTLSCYSL